MNKEQREILVNFMESHSQLASGAFTNQFTYAEGNKLWDQLTVQLAACSNGASNKTREDWKKVK